MKRDQAIERTRDLLRLKHYSLATEQCYLGWLGRYMAWLPKAPDQASSEKKNLKDQLDLGIAAAQPEAENV